MNMMIVDSSMDNNTCYRRPFSIFHNSSSDLTFFLEKGTVKKMKLYNIDGTAQIPETTARTWRKIERRCILVVLTG